MCPSPHTPDPAPPRAGGASVAFRTAAATDALFAVASWTVCTTHSRLPTPAAAFGSLRDCPAGQGFSRVSPHMTSEEPDPEEDDPAAPSDIESWEVDEEEEEEEEPEPEEEELEEDDEEEEEEEDEEGDEVEECASDSLPAFFGGASDSLPAFGAVRGADDPTSLPERGAAVEGASDSLPDLLGRAAPSLSEPADDASLPLPLLLLEPATDTLLEARAPPLPLPLLLRMVPALPLPLLLRVVEVVVLIAGTAAATTGTAGRAVAAGAAGAVVTGGAAA